MNKNEFIRYLTSFKDDDDLFFNFEGTRVPVELQNIGIVKNGYFLVTSQKVSLESLAEIEHMQWVGWSKDIAETEEITPARLKRWKKLWCHYAELSEEMKELDRKEARKVMKILFKEDSENEKQT